MQYMAKLTLTVLLMTIMFTSGATEATRQTAVRLPTRLKFLGVTSMSGEPIGDNCNTIIELCERRAEQSVCSFFVDKNVAVW